MSTEFGSDQVASGLYIATPTRCYRAMPLQVLEPGTPGHVLGLVADAVLALPRALVMAPALLRRRV